MVSPVLRKLAITDRIQATASSETQANESSKVSDGDRIGGSLSLATKY